MARRGIFRKVRNLECLLRVQKSLAGGDDCAGGQQSGNAPCQGGAFCDTAPVLVSNCAVQGSPELRRHEDAPVTPGVQVHPASCSGKRCDPVGHELARGCRKHGVGAVENEFQGAVFEPAKADFQAAVLESETDSRGAVFESANAQKVRGVAEVASQSRLGCFLVSACDCL